MCCSVIYLSIDLKFFDSDHPVEPGGAIAPPTKSKVLLLNLQIKPRMSLYLGDDQTGSFVIDAEVSKSGNWPINGFAANLLSDTF